ncbi:DUF3500 domain-containing protein [Sinomicrobium kalidii]|uniref:DUF3500 domain-containing protein n=1 Tax=Sinomicrobium kalidii TaxID=2900738 RepID=UPI001E54404A|nr:DUF3500 domain-containing protein [Sinomicrobium kalidii]UGU15463.1 DUF3500 domain-containing protein [Sinomicrobium kalidii]
MINFKITLLSLNMVFIGSCNSSDSDNYNVAENSDSNPDPIEVSDCSQEVGIHKIICLADAFMASLDDEQRSVVLKSYSVSEAKRWSNYPAGVYRNRVGLSFGEMTTEQIGYAKALLAETAGSRENEGWDELQQLMNADELLLMNGGSYGYGAASYHIALLGRPATTGTFEIQFGGHHMAFANTYTDGVLVSGTPSFRGVEPFSEFTYNGVVNQPLLQENDAFSTMLKALSTEELAIAEMDSAIRDIQAGPQRDNHFPSTAGLKCSVLTTHQKDLVIAAIETYVYDINDTAAEALIAIYANELNDTYIAYSGSTDLTNRNDYVRIDGPSVWIEYSCQSGINFPNETHPHSVWRDKSRDYGGNN